ncbi:DNA-directed RNA polymerase subunit alpha [Candidatus Wolfebacteria bacterium CG02_land_8_20_14_3_00_37_12]|uniref:DNA-directed RNA polymerase subunit alpha n=2 Tax=Candidatus Wolfeibacteriota TaxID=1752735 RepID=A0A2M7CQQ7_9BACT|nr:MAG: DNA-directed RNA polymerase subunit alpha [Candidatus Wolfebacteria bacterium CG02_land_8_20_14_3_00_37_12]PJA41861.1 MAG: DNA-directed RNA polymerase subunit alpha [Candidatus Wolfebacteria bacterium CG_4_9_14_3_um_filter_37_9]
MQYQYLSETVKIKKVSETNIEGVFEVEGLYAGYGLTLGNALRRVLLSSLPGSAITQIKIKGVKHEFSTIAGVKEDIVEIILNLKKIRFKLYSDEPQVLSLKAKGEKKVSAGDIEVNSEVEIVNSSAHILSLTGKNAEIEMELTVEKGLGYMAAENRKADKLPVGVIAIDSFFSPVISVNFVVENMRVGERTDYNKLRIFIKTDGSITPSKALHKSANILKDHIEKVALVEVKEAEPEKTSSTGKKRKKAVKGKEEKKKKKK